MATYHEIPRPERLRGTTGDGVQNLYRYLYTLSERIESAINNIDVVVEQASSGAMKGKVPGLQDYEALKQYLEEMLRRLQELKDEIEDIVRGIKITAGEITLKADQINLIAEEINLIADRINVIADEINIIAGEINLKAEQVNAEIGELNLKVGQFNADIEEFNLKVGQFNIDAEEVNARIGQFNLDADEVNAKINQFNLDVGDFNVKAEHIDIVAADIDTKATTINTQAETINIQAQLVTTKADRVETLASEVIVTADRVFTKADEITVSAEQITTNANNIKVNAEQIELNVKAISGKTTVAEVKGLLADYVTAEELSANFATIGELDAVKADVQELQGLFGDFSSFDVGILHADTVNATWANISGMNFGGSLVSNRSVSMGSVTSTGRVLSTGDINLQHSHLVSVSGDGSLKLGEVSADGGSFNIADTQFYKDGVSAAIESVTVYGPTVDHVEHAGAASRLMRVYMQGKASNGAVSAVVSELISAQPVYDVGHTNGWNDFREACSSVEAYTISQNAPGTLYVQSGGEYISVGSSWVQVTRKYGVYTIPDAIT